MAAATSPAEREARACYRQLSDAELAGLRNGLAHELAACGDLDPASADVCRLLVGDDRRAAEAEAEARQRRCLAGTGPDPATRWSEAWAALAAGVRQRADVVAVFEGAGYPLVRQGTEWGGPCLVCGGTDRLRVFPEPSARQPVPHYWCRRCGLWGDPIHALRSLRPGLGFYDAVTELAAGLGLPVPSAPGGGGGGGPDPRGTHRGPVPLRAGGRRRA